VPRELAATLPMRLQELLGYNIYPPFLGYVDGRHPRRYVDAEVE
jgi:ectoine hydroxylase-related dioxygenase (phytanoyl-CoA dioxygenase family)